MRNMIFILVSALLAGFGAGNAFADAEANQGYFSVMGSYMDDDKNRNVEDAINGGQFGFGYALNEAWNIEAVYSAAEADTGVPNGSGQQSISTIGVDVQRVFRRSEPFSPYLFFGASKIYTDVNNGSDFNSEAIAGGAGFLMDLFSSNVALRAEWRVRQDIDSSPRDYKDNLFSLGVQLPFGAATPKFVDSDGDGVHDGNDRCPNTPAGAPVDASGCELDSDRDGVKDSKDKCPGTPAGVRVNADGCAVDSDGDGVSDDKDKCPGTPRGAKVDANGCELDGDKDGVVDRLDECPNSPAGAQVDVKGCEIKDEIKLPGVNFESNSDRLLPGAEGVLNDAAATLRKNPSIRVEVQGHTDSDGAAEYNESLSARRAATVHDYLVARGVAADRMTVRGYGESQPIADNTTATGKAQNRRVVLGIIER